MAARDFLKVCSSSPQHRGLYVRLLLIAALMVLVSGSFSFAQDLPHIALECPRIQKPATPFEVRVIVSWKGDAHSHVIVPPEPVFPESFSLRSSSFEATVNDSLHQLTYRFILVPSQTGQFAIYPVEVRCWPRDSTTELSLLTDTCTITIEHASGLPFKKTLTAASIMLVIIATGIYLLRKRANSTRSSRQPEVESCHSLVRRCRRERLQGDYTAFYTTALKAACMLMPTDKTLQKQIETYLEREQFSSQKPSAEYADHVLRKLEDAQQAKPNEFKKP